MIEHEGIEIEDEWLDFMDEMKKDKVLAADRYPLLRREFGISMREAEIVVTYWESAFNRDN